MHYKCDAGYRHAAPAELASSILARCLRGYLRFKHWGVLVMRLTALLAFSAVVALILTSVGLSPASAARYRAYATDGLSSGMLTPVELATNTAGTPITVGTDPIGVAITPNGKTAYVTNAASGTVTPIELATNTAGTPITVGTDPIGVAITPNGKTAYVTEENGVMPIEVATNKAGTPIPVGHNPYGIAITPDGKTAYVTQTNAADTVTPVDLTTHTAGTPIAVGAPSVEVAITPDGKTAYVTTEGLPGAVTPIELATNIAGTPITVGAEPEGVAITPDGATAYVANGDSSTVTPIALATNKAGTPIAVGLHPYWLAITPDGRTAYVTTFDPGTLTPIEVATDKVGTPIPLGSAYTGGVAITRFEPTFKKCEHVPVGSGEFGDSSCRTLGGHENHELVSAQSSTIKSSSGTVRFEAPGLGALVTCAKSKDVGTITSETTNEDQVTLSKCESVGNPCTASAVVGTIESFPLISSLREPTPGLVEEVYSGTGPGGTSYAFGCGGLEYKIRGSVGGIVSLNLNTVLKEGEVTFSRRADCPWKSSDTGAAQSPRPRPW